MNQKVYDALMKAGRPEAACRKAAEAADRRLGDKAVRPTPAPKVDWREQLDALK